MNHKLSKTERSAFLVFGGAVLIVTLIGLPAIFIITVLEYYLDRKEIA